MSARRFILAGLLSVSSAAPALANIDCGSVDAVWNSAALVRQMQSTQDDPSYQRNIQRLEVLLQSMRETVNALEGGSPRDQERIGEFVFTMETAMTAAQAGRRDLADRLFADSLGPAFFQSLDALDEDGNCSQAEFDASFQADQYMAETPLAGSGDTQEIKLVPGSLAGSGQGVTTTDSNLVALDSYQGPRFRPGILFKGDLAVFFAMLAGLLLIPALIYWRRTSSAFQSREARRVLRMQTTVRLDTSQSTMQIEDISMNGMKLNHGGTIQHQKRLFIQLAGDWVLGHIRWQNASYAGIQFDRPISEQTLEVVTGSPQA